MIENISPPQVEATVPKVETDEPDTRTLEQLNEDLGKDFSSLTLDEMLKELPNGSETEEVAAIMRNARAAKREQSGEAKADAAKPLGVQLLDGQIISQASYDALTPEQKAELSRGENPNIPDEL